MAFAALQGDEVAVKRGIIGIIRSYWGIAQGRDSAAAGAERPGGRGSAGLGSPVCYLSLEVLDKKPYI